MCWKDFALPCLSTDGHLPADEGPQASRPADPYQQGILSTVPSLSQTLQEADPGTKGQLPSPLKPTAGVGEPRASKGTCGTVNFAGNIKQPQQVSASFRPKSCLPATLLPFRLSRGSKNRYLGEAESTVAQNTGTRSGNQCRTQVPCQT